MLEELHFAWLERETLFPALLVFFAVLQYEDEVEEEEVACFALKIGNVRAPEFEIEKPEQVNAPDSLDESSIRQCTVGSDNASLIMSGNGCQASRFLEDGT